MKTKLSDDAEQVLGTPSFITMHGGTLSRTSSDYRDNLERIKKDHPGSTIKS